MARRLVRRATGKLAAGIYAGLIIPQCTLAPGPVRARRESVYVYRQAHRIR
jgi:hypothetical protein